MISLPNFSGPAAQQQRRGEDGRRRNGDPNSQPTPTPLPKTAAAAGSGGILPQPKVDGPNTTHTCDMCMCPVVKYQNANQHFGSRRSKKTTTKVKLLERRAANGPGWSTSRGRLLLISSLVLRGRVYFPSLYYIIE